MFIQSVRSKAGRVVVSADQLRVVIRVRRDDGWRRRVAASFAGYLAEDDEPSEILDAEWAVRWPFSGGAFSALREAHAPSVDSLAVTGGGVSWAVGLGAAIDAPEIMPAGGMLWVDYGALCDRGMPSPLNAYRWLQQ